MRALLNELDYTATADAELIKSRELPAVWVVRSAIVALRPPRNRNGQELPRRPTGPVRWTRSQI